MLSKRISVVSWTIFAILANFIQGVDACDASPEECLLVELFSYYQVYARPVETPSDTVLVSISFRPTSLIGIDEKNEVMNLVGVITAKWNDPRLSWNSSEYEDAGVLNIRAQEIWLPDLALYNSADTFYHKTHREDFFTVIRSNGDIEWSFGGIFATTCSLDIGHYPFDSQTCTVELNSWGYSTNLVDFEVNGDINIDTLSSNSLWNLDSSSVERTETTDPDGESYAGITFSITWTRKTLYYQFNFVVPIAMLLVVTFGIFWLPPDCGERMSLAITVQLAYAVFLIVIMDSTPANSDTVPVISEFVMLVMVGTTLTLVESLLIVYLSYRNGRPPRWLRKFAFVFLATLFCSKSDVPQVEDNSAKDDKNSSGKVAPVEIKDIENPNGKIKDKLPFMDSEMAAILASVKVMQKILEDKTMDETHLEEWKVAAKLIDRLLFWIFLVAFTIAIIALFTSVNGI